MFRWHAKSFASAGLAGALLASAVAHAQEAEQIPPRGVQARQFSLKQIKKALEVQTNALAEQKRVMEEQEKKNSSQRRSLSFMKKQLAAQKLELDEARRRLEAIQAQIDEAALKAGATMATPTGPLPVQAAQAPNQEQPPSPPTQSAAQVEPTPAQAPVQPPPQPAQTQTPPPDQPVGQRPPQPAQSAPPLVTAIFEQPGALTPRGKFVLEPSLQYSYSSTYRVALIGYTVVPSIHIGLIDIRGVNDSTWIAALTARYGVTNRLELEFKLPYVSRNDATVTRTAADPTNDSVFDTAGHGIGDVEIALRYQLNTINGDMPYYIAGLRLKARNGNDPFSVPYSEESKLQSELPTGSGFVALQPSLSVIYPTDPAVFFGGINYVKNIDRDVGEGRGMIHPGNAVGLNFGMGLALNEKTSFSIGVEYTRVGQPSATGGSLTFPASTSTQLSTLLFGYSYRLSPSTSINFSVGAGLTPDAPGVQMMLRMPISVERGPRKLRVVQPDSSSKIGD
mgnify:CR=1 FL=1